MSLFDKDDLINEADKPKLEQQAKLTKSGITINHASRDADLLIVQTALKEGKHYPTVLTDEDTDLIVLALYHLGMKKGFASEIKQNRASSQH